MKNNVFTSTEPLDYHKINSDSSRHLRYHDYKHLTGVKWQADSEPLTEKVIASVGFIILFLLILFI
jgi:hypothetical protein